MFNNFLSWINKFPLRKGSRDRWEWRGGTDNRYSTKDAYSVLSSQGDTIVLTAAQAEGFKIIWNKYTPVKVSAHAWRVLWDRLPTKFNLHRLNILQQQGDLICPICNVKNESGDHVFFECDVTYKVWMRFLDWLGASSVLQHKPAPNLIMHSRILHGNKVMHIAVSLWLCVIWSIWRGRTDLVFKEKVFNVDKVVNEIKSRLWSWALC